MQVTKEQLAAWRKAKGLTLEQAAARVGVTLGTFWRWEQGKRPSRLATERLRQVMGDKQ